MKDMFNKLAEKQIKKYVENTYKPIKVESGKCRYNYKCQMNAVHEAIKKKHKKIAMCVCVENGFVFIHFINYRKGIFIDNTLGEWSAIHDYYLVRFIKEKEFYSVNSIFTSFRGHLQTKLSWLVRLFNTQQF